MKSKHRRSTIPAIKGERPDEFIPFWKFLRMTLEDGVLQIYLPTRIVRERHNELFLPMGFHSECQIITKVIDGIPFVRVGFTEYPSLTPGLCFDSTHLGSREQINRLLAIREWRLAVHLWDEFGEVRKTVEGKVPAELKETLAGLLRKQLRSKLTVGTVEAVRRRFEYEPWSKEEIRDYHPFDGTMVQKEIFRWTPFRKSSPTILKELNEAGRTTGGSHSTTLFDYSRIAFSLRGFASESLVQRDLRGFFTFVDPRNSWELFLRNLVFFKCQGCMEEALLRAYSTATYEAWKGRLPFLMELLRVGDKKRFRRAGDRIPRSKEFTLYRGVSGRGREWNVRGVKWTSNLRRAMRIALRQEDLCIPVHEPTVYETTVSRDDVIAYLGKRFRDEDEFLILPNKVKGRKVTWDDVRMGGGVGLRETPRKHR